LTERIVRSTLVTAWSWGLADQHLAVARTRRRTAWCGALRVGDDDGVATLQYRDDRLGS
jgi:hypothetical protein